MQKEAQGKKSSPILCYPGAAITVIVLGSFSAHSVFTPEPLAQLGFASSAFLDSSPKGPCVSQATFLVCSVFYLIFLLKDSPSAIDYLFLHYQFLSFIGSPPSICKPALILLILNSFLTPLPLLCTSL